MVALRVRWVFELGKAGTLLLGLIASGVESVVALALVACVYLLR